MITDTSAAAARAFYEPLSTGDTSVLDEVLSPDWEAVPALRTGAGPEGWRATVLHLRGVFSDLATTVEDVVAAGELVAVRTTSRGTHTGELLGLPGTGRAIEFRAHDFHRVVDGRIAVSWHLEDYFAIATQLGLSLSR